MRSADCPVCDVPAYIVFSLVMMLVKPRLITELYSHIIAGSRYSNLNGKSAVETIEYTHVYYVLNHTFMIHVH